MPATVPACCGSRWRSRLICGKAREVFVRSIKAIVYIISATGIIRIQRSEIREEEISALASLRSAVVIEITESREMLKVHTTDGNRCASLAKCSLGLYLAHPNRGALLLVMRDAETVAIQFRRQ